MTNIPEEPKNVQDSIKLHIPIKLDESKRRVFNWLDFLGGGEHIQDCGQPDSQVENLEDGDKDGDQECEELLTGEIGWGFDYPNS